jgi:DNA invertase Pin-like site-specific DNA recombinase
VTTIRGIYAPVDFGTPPESPISAWGWRSATGRKTRRASAEPVVRIVSVTQTFNTTTSMGRLTLNVLLSFALFEREVTGERIRDKIAASRQKGMWMGGYVLLGYPRPECLSLEDVA